MFKELLKKHKIHTLNSSHLASSTARERQITAKNTRNTFIFFSLFFSRDINFSIERVLLESYQIWNYANFYLTTFFSDTCQYSDREETKDDSSSFFYCYNKVWIWTTVVQTFVFEMIQFCLTNFLCLITLCVFFWKKYYVTTEYSRRFFVKSWWPSTESYSDEARTTSTFVNSKSSFVVNRTI